MDFELKPLPYPKDALEPHVSAETLDFHHDRHHRGYLEKLEKLIGGSAEARESLESIVLRASGTVFDNAAQAWNHDFLWRSMTPPGDAAPPDGDLADSIGRRFGGLTDLRTEFVEAGVSQFGSGYVWLVADGDRLAVESTHDADNPLRHGRTPLLTCDVWEHAYYLDYRNDRERYLEAFFDHLANWKFAAANWSERAARR
ncbi:MAG: superoxide dismutase [Fe] [Proteobacteria bacterium]|nr:MAG: superoxide dismutase [Fe] [Pseudomonadota bacterium]